MRASSTNFHSESGSPASTSWRVALRSELPWRIEKSTVGAASSMGESAYQNSQPQNPMAAAATARTKSFRRNSIDASRASLDNPSYNKRYMSSLQHAEQ